MSEATRVECPEVAATACHHLQSPGGSPFDPVALALKTEQVVCRGAARKYHRFGFTKDYFWGVATGYCYGCCLRCVFCWASQTRDNAEEPARFWEPDEVVAGLEEVGRRKRTRQARLSEGEPTIGKEHLLGVLEGVERNDYFKRFYLETNGVLLGADEELVGALAKFKKLWIRVSLKAGTPEGWARKTGATPESFDLPFDGLRLLLKHGFASRLSVAAMSADPRLMGAEERVMLIAALARVDPKLVLGLNEEHFYPYKISMRRLEATGQSLKRYIPIPGLWRVLTVSYPPVSQLARKRISLKRSWDCLREHFRRV